MWPDESLQAADRQLGPWVRAAAGVRQIQADPTVPEPSLQSKVVRSYSSVHFVGEIIRKFYG